MHRGRSWARMRWTWRLPMRLIERTGCTGVVLVLPQIGCPDRRSIPAQIARSVPCLKSN
jgi:hypothetical protein